MLLHHTRLSHKYKDFTLKNTKELKCEKIKKRDASDRNISQLSFLVC